MTAICPTGHGVPIALRPSRIAARYSSSSATRSTTIPPSSVKGPERALKLPLHRPRAVRSRTRWPGSGTANGRFLTDNVARTPTPRTSSSTRASQSPPEHPLWPTGAWLYPPRSPINLSVSSASPTESRALATALTTSNSESVPGVGVEEPLGSLQFALGPRQMCPHLFDGHLVVVIRHLSPRTLAATRGALRAPTYCLFVARRTPSGVIHTGG
jgi:hypothetical protein